MRYSNAFKTLVEKFLRLCPGLKWSSYTNLVKKIGKQI